MSDAAPHSKDTIVGVLLAGGQSRRMGGGDKCLSDLGGETLLERARRRLAPHVSQIILNANGDPARFNTDLPIAADPVEGFAGPLAGVLAGLRWAQDNVPQATAIVTVPTDAPFFPDDLVARFLADVTDNNIAITLASSAGRLHPVFGLWPVALADDLETSLNNDIRKVLAWTDRHTQYETPFDEIAIGGQRVDPFFNTNRPEDLDEARAILEAQNA